MRQNLFVKSHWLLPDTQANSSKKKQSAIFGVKNKETRMLLAILLYLIY